MSRSERKWEHIQYALQTGQSRFSGFDDITFVHQSLPETSIGQIELNSKIGGLSMGSPIFINAMTGGGGEKTLEINRALAITARETNIAMAVGSQMSALRDAFQSETYKIVRRENPNGLLFANLGSEASVEDAKKACEMIEANALQIHLNVIQELVMPEGDRDFTGALKRIERIVKELDVPVIIKEVGFGMSMETVSRLYSIGVAAVDVGGFGGTNFSRIENARRKDPFPFFDHWGIPTAASIIEAKSQCPDMPVIGSGGVQDSLDAVKALSLGASAVGMAGRFLKVLLEEGFQALIEDIKDIKKEMSILMTALGAKNMAALQCTPIVISGRVHHWLVERGIDTQQFSKR